MGLSYLVAEMMRHLESTIHLSVDQWKCSSAVFLSCAWMNQDGDAHFFLQDKFSESFMDGDLWDWPYDQGCCFSDADESSYSVESGWQADFYFGNGKDVIEENAMNEKYCVQVLKILIRKADADIDDLEKDLVLLQCDLAWTESRKQFEVCCNALREKIDVLESSMKSLRQSDKITTDDQLPLHRQPAEKLYEILKPLLGQGCEQDDGQLVGSFCETSSIPGFKVKSEEMEDNSFLLAVDAIPKGSVRKHKENGSIRDKEVKPEIAVDRVCSRTVVTEENSCLKLENLKSVSKVKNEEAKERCLNGTCTSRKLKSSSNLVGERGLLKGQKHGISVSEEANPDVPRQSDGFSGNKRSYPNSSFSVHSKSGNCNVEEKLINFFLRRKKNKSDEEPILPESNESASSCLSSSTKGKVDNNLQALETEEPGSIDTSNFPIILLPKQQDQQGKDIAKTQTRGIDKLLPQDSQNVENVSHEKSHLNVGHKPKILAEKGWSKSHTSFSKAKKRRKPVAIRDNACFDPPFEQKPLVKSFEPCQLKAKMQDDALDVDENFGSLLQKKGTSKMLVGQEFKGLSSVDDISSSNQIKPDRRTREDIRMKSCTTSDAHSSETLAHLPSSDLKLNDLSLVDLRGLAKQLKLTKYHKLRKSVLLDLLVGQMESC